MVKYHLWTHLTVSSHLLKSRTNEVPSQIPPVATVQQTCFCRPGSVFSAVREPQTRTCGAADAVSHKANAAEITENQLQVGMGGGHKDQRLTYKDIKLCNRSDSPHSSRCASVFIF